MDYIFASQNLQPKTRNVGILNTVSADHLSVFCSLLNSTEFPKGPSTWKFNNSPIFDCNLVKETRCYKHDTKACNWECFWPAIPVGNFKMCITKIFNTLLENNCEGKKKKAAQLRNKPENTWKTSFLR